MFIWVSIHTTKSPNNKIYFLTHNNYRSFRRRNYNHSVVYESAALIKELFQNIPSENWIKAIHYRFVVSALYAKMLHNNESQRTELIIKINT